jgi:hypothetical protein
MRQVWITQRRSFFSYRHTKILWQRWTPFGPYAIPGYIVECESHGDWNAVNPKSGARGRYQFLPSSYAAWCTRCDWSHLDQTHAAYDYYRAAGAGPWVCG